MENKTARISYIDVAKGIAIWLMIQGHQYISEQTSLYINSFHMPLFFFISGMFFRIKKPFFQELESAVRGLLVPYLFFSVLNLAVCWISPYVHPELYYNIKGFDVFKAAITGIFIGMDRVTPTSFLPLGPLWFLMALFVIRIFCSAIASFVKREFIWAFVTIFISIVLYFVVNTSVYSLDSALMSTPFYVAGFWVSKFDIQNLRFKPLILLCLILYFILVVPFNGTCSSDGARYGNWLFFYYFNAIVGTMIVLISSLYVQKCNILEKIGRNTLVILGTHAFFIKAMQIVSVLIWGTESMHSLFYVTLVPLITIACCFPVGILVNKYIPFAVGKKQGS